MQWRSCNGLPIVMPTDRLPHRFDDRAAMTLDEVDLIQRIQSASWFRDIAPALSIRDDAAFATTFTASGDLLSAKQRERFDTDGWFVLPSCLQQAVVGAVRDAILALEAAGVPALFVYVYDEAWRIPEVFGPRLAHLTGPLGVLPDIWAWHLAQGVAARGWRSHRGCYDYNRDADGRPQLINVWVALTDVDENNACMWLVPRSQDRDYPQTLASHTASEKGISVPLAAGDMVGWDANVLHWGGAMTPAAAQPRISLSFSLRACGDTASQARASTPAGLDFAARLRLISEMIGTYRDLAAPMPPAIERWANARRWLSALRPRNNEQSPAQS